MRSQGGPVGYARPVQKLRFAGVFLSILVAPVALAQTASVDGLVAQRVAAERAHAWRIAAWGAASLAAGTTLVLSSRAEGKRGRRAFGLQTAGWGVINSGIAVAALTLTGDAPTSWAEAIGAEDHLGNVMLVNLGLDVGYVLVGATLLAVAGRGVPTPAAWRGHGAAVVAQGVMLLALDVIVYAGSSDRLEALVGIAPHASLGLTPAGLTLQLPF